MFPNHDYVNLEFLTDLAEIRKDPAGFIDSEKELRNHFALGGLFENMVILDLYKQKLNSFSSSKIYFFRDSQGKEIDLLIDTGSELIPIEIKASATFSGSFLKNIKYFNSIRSKEDGRGYIVYSGKNKSKIQGIELVNYKELERIEF